MSRDFGQLIDHSQVIVLRLASPIQRGQGLEKKQSWQETGRE